MDRGKKRYASGSRLSEMPMRVADKSKQSMYATPQSQSAQPSYGKLSMSNPQSGTSERRTPFFGARASGLGSFGGRNSLFGAASGKKDTRPLHDKNHVQQCIRKLCEFLTENGFPEVSIKSLQSPSTKEFLKLFEFIYKLLDPTFEMPKSKVEEEVPRLLRDLGYPFPLSKSSMYSVGAPHTWPQVLAALIWLIDTMKIYRCLETEDDLLFKKGFPEDETKFEESVEHNKLCQEFMADTYTKFMQGADTFEEEEHVFLSELKKAYSVDEAQLASMEQKYTLLSKQVEQLENEKHSDPLMNKRIKKDKLQVELQKMDTYLSELVTYKTRLEKEDSRLAEELQAAGHHLDSLTREQARLKNLLANQKYTPADIERLNREKMELQQKISSLCKAQEEAEQHAWQEEMGLAKIKERVELKVAEYRKMARTMKLIPASAENACGQDFDIQTNSMYEPGAMVEYKARIELPLKKMITDMDKENERMANKKLSLQEVTEEMNSQILQKTKELKLLREQTSKLDLQLEQDMQEMVLEEQKWTAEKESVEKHQKHLMDMLPSGLDDAHQKLKAAQQQFHLVQLETTEERRTVCNNMATIFTHAAEHVAILEKSMDKWKGLAKKMKAKREENHQMVQQIKEMVDAFIEKANSV